VEGSCAHPNESFVFIPGGEFFDQLSNYQLLRDITVRCLDCVTLMWHT